MGKIRTSEFNDESEFNNEKEVQEEHSTARTVVGHCHGAKYLQLPHGTMTLLSKRALGMVIGKDYVDWAMRALMDGFDSYSLAMLAGLDMECAAYHLPVSHVEAHGYFLKIVKELALPIPDIELALSSPDVWHIIPFPYDDTVLLQHLDELAEQICEGVIDPVIGVSRIHTEVVTPLNYPPDLMPWHFLYEGNAPDGCFRMYSQEEYLAEIVAYVTLWMKNHG